MKEFTVRIYVEMTSSSDGDIDSNIENDIATELIYDVSSYLENVFDIDIYDTNIGVGEIELYCDSDSNIELGKLEDKLDDKFNGHEVGVESDKVIQRAYSPLELEPEYETIYDKGTINGFEVTSENIEEDCSCMDDPFLPDKGAGVAMFNNFMGEDIDTNNKLFQINYRVNERGTAVHSWMVDAPDEDTAVDMFYDMMDDKNLVADILTTKLVRG